MSPPREDQRRGLGRGLSALIGEESVRAPSAPARTLPVAFLRPGRFQPRKQFDDAALADLARSVAEKGVLTPILVRPVGADAYEIVAGERRWRAAQLAKLHNVPVLVREMADGEALEIAIIENVQRADLNAIEEAEAYQNLITRFGRTQEQVAEQVGKSRPHIANTLRLLKLPESVKTLLRDGKLTAGHARTLLSAPDPEAMAREILHGAMTVRAAERRAAARKPRGQAVEDPNIADMEASISNRLGLKVKIVHKGDKGGDIRIAYSTLEQLDDVARRLGRG